MIDYKEWSLLDNILILKRFIANKIIEVGTNNDPYLFRRSPQIGDYNAEHDEIVGVSVGWNQLASTDNVSTQSSSDVIFTLNNDGSYTISGTASGRVISSSNVIDRFYMAVGHKYLFLLSKDISPIRLRISAGVSTSFFANTTIVNCTSAENLYAYFDSLVDISGTTVSVAKLTINIIDLTAMLGTTIADYIYTLEQGTAGAGVSFYRKYFGDRYVPFCQPTIRSVEGLVSHEMVGKNLFDVQSMLPLANQGYIGTNGEVVSSDSWLHTDYIPIVGKDFVLSNIGGNSPAIALYDANKNLLIAKSYNTGGASTLANVSISSQTNASFARFSVYTDADKSIIQLEHGSTATDYAPYSKHSYPLDSTKTLRGLLKLDNGKLKADGDTYEANGTITRNYGERAYQSGDESDATVVTDGTTTVYKLTTPTTETAQPFAKSQKVSPSGTEEYVSTGVVPVGHETTYIKK